MHALRSIDGPGLASAQFGVPLYGGALTGEIVYMEANKLGCNVFERPLVAETLPVFLLVDRGGLLLCREGAAILSLLVSGP